MKKRSLALIMAGIMTLGLTGCGSEAETQQVTSDYSVEDALEKHKQEKSGKADLSDEKDEDEEESKEEETKEAEKEDDEKEDNEKEDDEKEDDEVEEDDEKEDDEKEDDDEEIEEENDDNEDFNVAGDNPLGEFEMTINGETLELPMWFSDMEEAGWEFDGEAGDEISARSAEGWHSWEKDGITLTTTLANYSVNTAKYEDCIITTLDYSLTGNSEDDDVELPGGIQLHKSTFDDMVEVYGEPSDTYHGEDSNYYFVYYEFDYEHEYIFIVDFETNIVRDVEIECEEELDGVNNEVNDERPDILDDYEAPSKLSADPYDATLELDGVVYQLPCPVEVFMDNGWELEEGDDNIISSASYDYFTLVKDDIELDAVIKCPTKDAVYAKYGYVTKLRIDAYDGEKYPFELFGGIEMGEEVSPEEIEELYEDMEVDADLSDEDMQFFHIDATDDESMVSYYIVINDGVIGAIEVENDVRFER